MTASTTVASQALTANAVRAEIAEGRLTVRDYVESLLERINEREPAVMAFEEMDAEAVRRRADALDRTGGGGALYGIPFAAKDIIDSADLPTRHGSPIHGNNRPGADAACISNGVRAGGILMGKAVTTEFANIFPGKTVNPFDPSRTSGGSSSGSAAAVGDGMVPLAIGTQTTSSTIRPASYCGVYGYIPSYGDLSLSGVRQSSWTLDRLGLFARSVEDVHLHRRALQAREVTPLEEASTHGLRVAFCRTHLWDRVDAATQQSFETAARRLSDAGAKVVELELAPEFTKAGEAHRWISSYEFTRNYMFEIDRYYDKISERLRSGRVRDGLSCDWETYRRAIDVGNALRSRFRELMQDFDVVLTAGASGEAPDRSTTGDYSFCALWTLVYVPCISIPAFRGPDGLPVGAQLVGKAGADEALLAAARAVATTLDALPGID